MKLILNQEDSFYSCNADFNESNINQLTQKLDYPRISENTSFGPRIIGSCRGLLCLNYPECSVLWNPSTKTHHKIPEPENDSEFEKRKNWRFYAVHGLGYDEINDDFKVIRVYQYIGPQNGAKKLDCEVLVYSLKRGSWRRISDFPYFVPLVMMNDVFVNGALHFKVSNKTENIKGDDTVDERYMVLAFDVSSETYTVLTRLGSKMKIGLELGVFGDHLCMIRNYQLGVSQLLVMKEYGVNSSWAELLRVKRADLNCSRLGLISYLGNEKQVLLEGDNKILCFDVEGKSAQSLDVKAIDLDCEIICVCMESEVVLDIIDGNEDDKMNVNEEDVESEAILGIIDGKEDEKMKKSEEDVESKVVLGVTDDNEDDKMQTNEEDVERVSTERDSADT